MAEEESVKVAVRMRLFNGREKNAGAQRIVRMQNEDVGSKTYITNPDTGEEKHFSFDYSFQSHSETEQGIGPYATQDTVFNELGKPVLYTALEGRNVCLFAYGQTGAGKSFSMLGKSEPREMQGIIPRSCLEIFRLRDVEKDDPCIAYNVSIQVVEVYCEMINDLLADRKTWPPNGHKARLTKDGYVVDTVTRPCFDYNDIEGAFTFADKNRSVGSHALNPESSRAHTIYTINYERKKKTSPDAKQEETITAKINLVDLAGSERSESAGTSGQMLKEGNAINLSLTALGSTIKALSEGKRPNFRDSKLTLLLQGSMTNGKVIMIAAVSPASICYDESMSTLRFAERIKMVKIRAKKNVTQDPVAEIKKEMEEMRQRMQEEIDALKSQCSGEIVDPAKREQELQELLEMKKEAERQLKEDFDRRLKEMNSTEGDRRKIAENINKNWSNALGGAAMQKAEEVKEPHLRNLNEDTRLAETLVYPFKPGTTKVGRANKENPPDIEFNGMGILKGHCEVVWDQEAQQVWIIPSSGSATVVNGKRVSEKTELVHNNRVWLGNNYAFRFCFPGCEDKGEKFDTPPDYLYAEAEIAENTNTQTTNSEGLPTALGHQLSEALKKVEQANIIANDLNRDCVFQPKIIKSRVTGNDTVVVCVQQPQGELTWPWDKFNERLVEMVKVWQAWQYAQDNEKEFTMPDPTESPFVDSEDQLIGESDVWLQSLGNMIDHDADSSVLAPTGVSQGKIQVEIKPLDKNGNEGPWEDDKEDLDPFVDKPSDLIGTTIRFKIKIKKIIFDAQSVLETGGQCKFEKVWVRYKINIKDDTEQWTKTDPVEGGPVLDPTFNFEHTHDVKVDSEFARHLEKDRINFQVWGRLVNSSNKSGGGCRQIELQNSIRDKQAEVLTLLPSLVDEVPKDPLPEGWGLVLGFKGPDGHFQLTVPE